MKLTILVDDWSSPLQIACFKALVEATWLTNTLGLDPHGGGLEVYESLYIPYYADEPHDLRLWCEALIEIGEPQYPTNEALKKRYPQIIWNLALTLSGYTSLADATNAGKRAGVGFSAWKRGYLAARKAGRALP